MSFCMGNTSKITLNSKYSCFSKAYFLHFVRVGVESLLFNGWTGATPTAQIFRGVFWKPATFNGGSRPRGSSRRCSAHSRPWLLFSSQCLWILSSFTALPCGRTDLVPVTPSQPEVWLPRGTFWANFSFTLLLYSLSFGPLMPPSFLLVFFQEHIII